MKSNYILITGCAGFIGFHLSKYLLNEKNYKIIGIDNLNSYYDVGLKKDRLKILKKFKNFKFHKLDINNKKRLSNIFQKYNFLNVIHLAAQAGVRFSISNREQYFDSNIRGFFNILELSKKYKIKHLLFASTSSVYGNNFKQPFKETYQTDTPLSFYAASKKINEIMAYPYSHLYKMRITGMRFFTVYGPFGRPDMALFKFVSNLMKNKKIELYNNGNHFRDFTYIDDIVKGIVKILFQLPKTNPPFQLINIGRGKPEHLKKFLNLIKDELKVKKIMVINKKMQKGDVLSTHASIDKLKKIYGYRPDVSIKTGIKNFIDWYKKYYN